MTSHPLRAAWEARDADAVAATFAEDGSFHSPVISAPGFRGHRAIAELMKVAFDVTTDTEFTYEHGDGDTHVLGFNTRFGGKPVKGVQLLELDERGKIRDLWVFVRPLTGVVAVSATMGPGLVGLKSNALRKMARVLVQPLVGLAAASDWVGSRVVQMINRRVR